ncbi:hypothetical protein [Shewanella algae]|uniref:hypothetical protein n=1 Tax=Shewanella algae TaxID=38313 RepID=UPI00118761FA|nr:hypothetical protein [Shewanella algae]TVO93205.1 hypothetical protein AYI86_19165 [Shewanella algae]
MSKPNVFIIESLDFEDEKSDRFEGKVLSQILKLNGIESEYYYIRTKQELDEIIDKFDESDYRYLHISCHGSPDSLETTLDSVSFEELNTMLSPCLDKKRVFISACEMVNTDLAGALIGDSECFSVIGPSEPVSFSDATIFWSSFYHLMFNNNENAMKRKEIKQILEKITDLFNVKVNYYSKSKSLGIKEVKY